MKIPFDPGSWLIDIKCSKCGKDAKYAIEYDYEGDTHYCKKCLVSAINEWKKFRAEYNEKAGVEACERILKELENEKPSR